MMKEYKAGIYLRLSKRDKEKNNSIDIQKEITTKYANEHGFKIEQEYIDNGYSGILDSRPALNKMMMDITRNKINMVIIKDMSRLTRNKNLTSYFTDIFFPDNDIRLISVTEYVDTGERYEIDDAVAIRGIVNQSYLEDISRKIKAVKRNFKLNGEFIEACVAYGYKKDQNDKHRIIIDKNVSYVIEKIYKLYLDNVSPKAIAENLNADSILTPSQYLKYKNQGKYWTKSMVDRILNNPIYTGRMILNKSESNLKLKKRNATKKGNYELINDTHQAIISIEDYNKVQEKKGCKTKESFGTYIHLLKGLVYCENCGRKMLYKNSSPIRIYENGKITGKKNDLGYYICAEHYRHPDVCNQVNKIMENNLDKIVLEKVSKRLKELQITKYAREVAILKQKSDCNVNEYKRIQNEIDKEEKRFKILYSKKVEGVINSEEFITKYNEYKERIKQLKIDKDRLDVKNKIKNDENTVKKLIIEFEDTKRFDNNIIKKLIEKIEIGKDQKVKISLKV